MANRFWVGGTGNFDNTTTHWSTTSGGSSGASVPGNSDAAIWDSLSGGGTCTVTNFHNCVSFNFSTYTGTLAGSSDLQVQANGSYTFGSSMTMTWTGNMQFTSGTTNTIT